jgi:hypothetical protein
MEVLQTPTPKPLFLMPHPVSSPNSFLTHHHLDRYFNTAKINASPLSNAHLTQVFTDLFAGATEPTNTNVLNSISSEKIPSTVFVWSQQGLTTQQASDALALYTPNTNFENVQNALSMYLPNAVQQDSTTFYRSLLVSSEAKDLSVDENTTCQQIVDFIAESTQAATKNSLLRANVADIANFSKFNQCLTQINDALNTATQGKFVSIVQGVGAENASMASEFQVQQTDDTPAVAQTKRADGRVGPRYVTSQTLVALFASFALLAFLLFGVYRLMAIEGPLRFPVASQVPPATREY